MLLYVQDLNLGINDCLTVVVSVAEHESVQTPKRAINRMQSCIYDQATSSEPVGVYTVLSRRRVRTTFGPEVQRAARAFDNEPSALLAQFDRKTLLCENFTR